MKSEAGTITSKEQNLTKKEARKVILGDYRLALLSREASLIGRKEVLTGKAKFGIFGDGKEVPQIAMAKYFREGDFRSGYYRDQTFMLAIGQLTLQQFFAQLYAHIDAGAEPASGGRSMNGHYATRSLNDDGSWKDLRKIRNSSPDISPTAGQMPRLLGLAQASAVYRNHAGLSDSTIFSANGNEVAFGTIGDASTSEGIFWESMNAAGVLQVPMVISVWDDGHGISVAKKYQTTKESISEIMEGFRRTGSKKGFEIFTVKGWDYAALLHTYEKASDIARKEHVPVLVHVEELTQPQGHSTSGSHERYKSRERLAWEAEFDCIRQFGNWIVERGIASRAELDALAEEAKAEARDARKAAWEACQDPIRKERDRAAGLLSGLTGFSSGIQEVIQSAAAELASMKEISRKDIYSSLRKILRATEGAEGQGRAEAAEWLHNAMAEITPKYSSHLHSQSAESPLKITEVAPSYSDDAPAADGRVVLRDNFEALMKRYPQMMIFGEDSGKIGDVNQGLEGLQEKFGELRISDTGIREATILGQGIGLAMRGLRPVAEIQYLDYVLYALQIMSDDLATIHYRTAGGSKAPLIVRTRGHRLEGIWHSGSPMSALLGSIRGIHICVPRNLTDAAAFYNTLMRGDDPGIIIEPLNAYRSKEKMPSNPGEYCLPLGVPKLISEGNDLTIVSYGSTCNIALQATEELRTLGIMADLLDLRMLLPFDINSLCASSLQKTNRLLIVDEDVPGGASSFIFQQIIEKQNGYFHLDSAPLTLTAKEHRPAYGTDGDYFSKPSADDIVEAAIRLVRET